MTGRIVQVRRLMGAATEAVGSWDQVDLNAVRRWSFPGAFLYSVSLVTTVGKV